jgi:hypothetical protein
MKTRLLLTAFLTAALSRPALAHLEASPFVLPDSVVTLGGFGLIRSGRGTGLGGGGELAYWRRFEGSFVYSGADIGVSDRSAYLELQVSREFGEWPARQFMVGAAIGPGIRLRTDDKAQRPVLGQATLWSTFRFKPSNIPSMLFPFFRVEVASEGTSFQGGLMLKVAIFR